MNFGFSYGLPTLEAFATMLFGRPMLTTSPHHNRISRSLARSRLLRVLPLMQISSARRAHWSARNCSSPLRETHRNLIREADQCRPGFRNNECRNDLGKKLPNQGLPQQDVSNHSGHKIPKYPLKPFPPCTHEIFLQYATSRFDFRSPLPSSLPQEFPLIRQSRSAGDRKASALTKLE